MDLPTLQFENEARRDDYYGSPREPFPYDSEAGLTARIPSPRVIPPAPRYTYQWDPDLASDADTASLSDESDEDFVGSGFDPNAYRQGANYAMHQMQGGMLGLSLSEREFLEWQKQMEAQEIREKAAAEATRKANLVGNKVRARKLANDTSRSVVPNQTDQTGGTAPEMDTLLYQKTRFPPSDGRDLHA
jgi:hypothetical protein